MSNDPYAVVLRKEPRSPLLVLLALTVALTGALLFMWSRGWFKFTRASAAPDDDP